MIVLALLIVAGAVTFVLTRPGPDPADDTLARYAAAWSRGDDRGAARLTDRPAVALAQLSASRRGLDGATVRAAVRSVSEKDDTATATLAVAWEIPRIGRYSYRTRGGTARRGRLDRALEPFRPPSLAGCVDAAGYREQAAPARADRGSPGSRARFRARRRAIDVQTSRAGDPGDTARRLADLLDDVDAARSSRRSSGPATAASCR